MKIRIQYLLTALAALMISTINSQLSTCFAQGTAFTYQGRLNSGANPANGLYDLTFALYSDSGGATQVGGTVTNTATGVTNGLFTVVIDFGSGIFNGTTLWMQIGVETNGGGSFNLLTPLQQLTPTPYAIHSSSAITANNAATATSASVATTATGVSAGAVTSAGIASASVVKSLNGLQDAVTLSPGANISITPGGNTLTISDNAWNLSGNAGTSPGSGNFIGTMDNQPLELDVNGARALRLEPNVNGPNVIGGAAINSVGGGYYGAAIGGGEYNHVTNNYGTVGGGYGNTAGGGTYGYATVGGGQGNNASGNDATVGGGFGNTASCDFATVGGGYGNTATASISSYYATVGGGADNTANGNDATVGGGSQNNVFSDDATVGGGFENTAGATGTSGATVGGGRHGMATGNDATVGGGYFNFATGDDSTVGGGMFNRATNNYATVPGGYGNDAGGYNSFAAGSSALATDDYSFVWGDGSQAANSQGAHSFTALATGGVWFFTGTYPAGVKLAPGASSWTTLSDRNAKKNIQPVDTLAVLNKLAAVPIDQWNYKWEKDDDVPNIGPMAQDFKAAFYPGRDNKGITTLEFDGVELAAIQGLNQKLNEKNLEIQKLQQQNETLEKRLDTLEQTIKSITQKQ